MPVEDGVHPLLQAFRRAGRGKAEIEVDHHVAGNDVVGARARVDVGHLPRGRQIVFIARVPLLLDQVGQRLRRFVDGVFRQVRVGNVALHTLDRQPARQRTAAAVLDHVA